MTKPMIRAKLALTVALIFTPLAASAAQSDVNLFGNWRALDGSSTVAIAKCSNSPDLCATVVAEQLEAGQPSSVGQVVVRDIRLDKKQNWRGTYILDGANYAAKIKPISNTSMAFKVCVIAFLCQTQIYERAT